MRTLVYLEGADTRMAPLNTLCSGGELPVCGDTVLSRVLAAVRGYDPDAVVFSPDMSVSDIPAPASELVVLRAMAFFDTDELLSFLQGTDPCLIQPDSAGRPAAVLAIRLSEDDFRSGVDGRGWLESIPEESVAAENSFALTYPWHLIEANVAALNQIGERRVEGDVEAGAVIEGAVVIEEGARVRSGTVIEGPVYIGSNSVVGPNAYIRPHCVISEDCHIGQGAELYDSVIGIGTVAKHRCYIGHSVIGSGANIGCGLVTSDYRHDGGNHITRICGEKVDSGRRKLGAFLGDRVRTGVQTVFYPGRKLWPDATTVPGAVITADVETD